MTASQVPVYLTSHPPSFLSLGLAKFFLWPLEEFQKAEHLETAHRSTQPLEFEEVILIF